MSIYRLSPVVLIAGIVFATQFANRLADVILPIVYTVAGVVVIYLLLSFCLKWSEQRNNREANAQRFAVNGFNARFNALRYENRFQNWGDSTFSSSKHHSRRPGERKNFWLEMFTCPTASDDTGHPPISSVRSTWVEWVSCGSFPPSPLPKLECRSKTASTESSLVTADLVNGKFFNSRF
ncbi:hypothetical protein Fcan01_10088 [Folsomia candida]|uniref:Uncharacterized protein n=1 Tax=Folsomia candida TaxID=158441 RepID=A0A226EC57_FOLCA|nr:hypothetical protein Fcan01_10088 [Folsomia candida]